MWRAGNGGWVGGAERANQPDILSERHREMHVFGVAGRNDDDCHSESLLNRFHAPPSAPIVM